MSETANYSEQVTPNYSDAEPIGALPGGDPLSGTVASGIQFNPRGEAPAEAPTTEYIPPDSVKEPEGPSVATVSKEYQPPDVTSTPIEGLNVPEGMKEETNEPKEVPPAKVGAPRSPGRSPRLSSPRVKIMNADGQETIVSVPAPQSGLFNFGNTEAIKEKVRNAKLRPNPYNVHDTYWKTGFFQWVAKSPVFENTTLTIIVINALWISIDTDGNTADTILDAEPVYVAADSLFFGYFAIELFIRFMAFKKKSSGFKDPWFVFDTTLVTLYLFDPFTIGLMAHLSGGGGLNLPTSVLRLFRLARLSRLVRMLRSLPELMIMIKGMVSAAASVGYTLGLLMLFTYVFAIAFRNLTPPDSWITLNYFSSVPETMHSLIVYGTFLDALCDFALEVKADSSACLALMWVYICLSALTVMNMLIGVLCEVIAAVAEEEKESMMVDKVNDKFKDIVKDLDTSGDGTLSWDEFQMILDFPQALKALESVNVDPEIMVDMAEDFFFEDGEKVDVTFDQFMEMVLDLRGGQNATVENIMTLAKRFNHKFLGLKTRMDTMDEGLQKIDDRLDNILRRKRDG